MLPLGPYTYQPNNPILLKPGGFMVVRDTEILVVALDSSFWHFATMSLSATVVGKTLSACLLSSIGWIDVLRQSFGDYLLRSDRIRQTGRFCRMDSFFRIRNRLNIQLCGDFEAPAAQGFSEGQSPQDVEADFRPTQNLTDENW